MKRLVLHIGTHKTGTTALQMFLEANAEALAQLGVGYRPTAGEYVGIKPNRNAHTMLYTARCACRDKDFPQRYVAVAQADKILLAEQKERFDTVILTDEALWFEGASHERFWDECKSYLDVFAFDRIQIIVYLRRQDYFIGSLWNQYVKGKTRESRALWEYAEAPKSRAAMDYDARLKQLEQLFGRENIVVREYNRNTFEGGDIFHDFFAAAGLPYSDSFVVDRPESNPGITNALALLKCDLNKSKAYLDTDNFLAPHARTASLRSTLGKEPPPFTLAQRNEILQRYAAGNERIAREYLGRADGQLFAPPPHDDEGWRYDAQANQHDAALMLACALTAERAARLKDAAAAKERESQLEARIAELEERFEKGEAANEKVKKRLAKLEKSAGSPNPRPLYRRALSKAKRVVTRKIASRQKAKR